MDRCFLLVLIAFGVSFTVHAKEAPVLELGDKAKVYLVTLASRETVTKIVDEVDGQKIVCYSLSYPGTGASGRSISCMQLDKSKD